MTGFLWGQYARYGLSRFQFGESRSSVMPPEFVVSKPPLFDQSSDLPLPVEFPSREEAIGETLKSLATRSRENGGWEDWFESMADERAVLSHILEKSRDKTLIRKGPYVFRTSERPLIDQCR